MLVERKKHASKTRAAHPHTLKPNLEQIPALNAKRFGPTKKAYS